MRVIREIELNYPKHLHHLTAPIVANDGGGPVIESAQDELNLKIRPIRTATGAWNLIAANNSSFAGHAAPFVHAESPT